MELELFSSCFGMSPEVVLHAGHIFGTPGVRGNHVLPHRSHRCSVITSMWITLPKRMQNVVALEQPEELGTGTTDHRPAKWPTSLFGILVTAGKTAVGGRMNQLTSATSLRLPPYRRDLSME